MIVLKKIAIFNCLLFIGGACLNFIAEQCRWSTDWRFIYEYGKILWYVIFFGTMVCAFVNSILILNNAKFNLKHNLKWALISLAPIILFGIKLIIP